MSDIDDQDHEERRDSVTEEVWRIWTKDGTGLNERERKETRRTVQGVVDNAYRDDISDADWVAAALATLTNA
jgi:hypothetical protein